MQPKNFNRDNFTPERAASAFSCAVWFDPDQDHGQYFHSWQNDLYKLNHSNGKTLHLVSHPRGLKKLKEMLQHFADPLHQLYKPEGFLRAEIYENFTGNIVHARTMTEVLQDVSFVEPQFQTRNDLGAAGRHRIVHALKSEGAGIRMVPFELVRETMNWNWSYWMKHSRYSDRKRQAAAA